MGNREALMAGAKHCLNTKGYQRTSARDIAAAAGTSLAAIGYHFGSKDALLNAAVVEASQEWGEELERALSGDIDPDSAPLDRFEAAWTRVVESFSAHRDLWAAQFKILAEIEELPDGGRPLIEALQQGRRELGSLFGDAGADDQEAWVVGSFYQALLTGVMAQWLIDPEHALSGPEIADALRAIVREAT
jgi:AcrR family transcriptional regulator